jgi:hypothetical protein
MKFNRKVIKKILLGFAISLMVIVTVTAIAMNWFQDVVVQKIVTGLNEDFKGALVIEDTDIRPFANFPYISLAIKNVQVFEDKEDMFAPILDVSDIYLGINFWSLLSGEFKVNMLKIENGNFDIYRYTDGSFNLVNALSGKAKINEIKEEYNIELKRIELANLDIIKYDEESRVHVETYIEKGTARFRNTDELLMIAIESQLLLNVINDGDSTIFTHKHFEASTELDYYRKTGELVIQPTVIKMKNADFNVAGKIDVLDEFNVDIDIHGRNPNFNLLIALAPKELIPTLELYENAGNIYFDISILGKTLSGEQPAIYAEFGCDNAYFKNPESQKQLEEISFSGHFTNGSNRDYSTMEFTLENVNAKPEAGIFNADLRVTNFDTPKIELSIHSEFNLDFLAKFLNIQRLQKLAGDVSLTMKFNDIIDIQNPEKSVEEFNKSYFSELNVNDLSFRLPDYHLTFDSIDIRATMDGNHANIEYFFMNIGGSDITIRGEIDDLPAIIHQSSDTVEAKLFIYSSLLNILELTSGDTLNKKPVDELIENLRLELSFKTTPKSLLNSPNLPVGDFFINNLYAKLSQYPHTFRKFNAHILVDDERLNIREFNGQIDKSDFTFSGIVDNYPLLMAENRKGAVDIDFRINSELLRLNDLFTYHGENYVPEDYRTEEISGLILYGNGELAFNDSLVRTKVFFDQLNARMKVHQMEMRDIHGKFTFGNEFISLDNMSGSIGNTSFSANMDWYRGENDSIRKTTNMVAIYSEIMDFDQLSNYNTRYTDSAFTVNHDSVFNIYTLPFTDLRFGFNIDQLRYRKHLVENLTAHFRIQQDHFLFVDTLQFQLSGGKFNITGYFDGSDPDKIYFYPNIYATRVNLEEVLYRFDNFGQDYIISENLAGSFSGKINGKIHMHADMVPQIEGSEIFLDFEIINGSLKNYKPLNSLSDYFKNRNLAHIRFDTLSNNLQIANGFITIPNMTINSSLGYLDISGSQSFDSHMEYYFQVPLKLVTSAAWQKLFGKKKTVSDSTHVDAIQYKDKDKKQWYVNLKLEGTPDNYNITLGKKQKDKG